MMWALSVEGRHRLLVSRKRHHRARLVETYRTVCRSSTDSTDSTVNQCAPSGKGVEADAAILATSMKKSHQV